MKHYAIHCGNFQLFDVDSEREFLNKRVGNSPVSLIMARTLTRSSLETTGPMWKTISPLIQHNQDSNELYEWISRT